MVVVDRLDREVVLARRHVLPGVGEVRGDDVAAGLGDSRRACVRRHHGIQVVVQVAFARRVRLPGRIHQREVRDVHAHRDVPGSDAGALHGFDDGDVRFSGRRHVLCRDEILWNEDHIDDVDDTVLGGNVSSDDCGVLYGEVAVDRSDVDRVPGKRIKSRHVPGGVCCRHQVFYGIVPFHYMMHQQGIKHLRIVEDCRKSLVAESLKCGVVRGKDRVRAAAGEHRLRDACSIQSIRKGGQVRLAGDQVDQRHVQRLLARGQVPGRRRGYVLNRLDHHPLRDDDDDPLHGYPPRRSVERTAVRIGPRIGKRVVERLVLLYPSGVEEPARAGDGMGHLVVIRPGHRRILLDRERGGDVLPAADIDIGGRRENRQGKEPDGQDGCDPEDG